MLSTLACRPETSRGRLQPEPQHSVRGPRDIYQRDRDRIIHSISFRRLRHKTQVFIAPEGDHYRVRLTHSLEVAQIGRTIARALGLNEDLTEALCLAHDIGHPPFGHAGERALCEALERAGGFDHNAHTLRTLALLDSPYPDRTGLNLSWELLEGLAKHNGPVEEPNWALAELDKSCHLDLHSFPSLEAQVAALSDDIAYDNHDIDDGIRAGLLSLEQLEELEPLAARLVAIRMAYPGISDDHLRAELVREQIGVMVKDLIETTLANVAESGVETVEDVRAAGRALVQFSPDMHMRERTLKNFMYANLYHHPTQIDAAEQSRQIISGLFDAYRGDPTLMPSDWRERLPADEPGRSRHIADFLAGMTDRYARSRYAEIVGG